MTLFILNLLLIFNLSSISIDEDEKKGVFIYKIAEIESSNRPYIVGGYKNNYIGKYQFGRLVLKELDFHIDKDMFLSNPREVFPEHVQDSLCLAYFRHIKYKYLYYTIRKYDGYEIEEGLVLNEAMILAGGHFLGVQGIKDYLYSDDKDEFKDGWGGHVRDYMIHFKDIEVKF